MLRIDHPGNQTHAKYFADALARSLCRETKARAWCAETNGYAPIKQKRCPVSLPGEVWGFAKQQWYMYMNVRYTKGGLGTSGGLKLM